MEYLPFVQKEMDHRNLYEVFRVHHSRDFKPDGVTPLYSCPGNVL